MTDPPNQDSALSNYRQWIIEEGDSDTRLDQFLTTRDFGPENALGLTRSRVKKLIDNGFVTVDGVHSRPAKKLHIGETVSIEIPPQAPTDLVPEDIPLDIYFEDEYVVVINKPQGMVVHPAPGHTCGTLVNALIHSRHMEGGDALRPGIVHRLDKDTSGLMVAAKREDAHAALAAQFHEHSVDRRYRVLVAGAPPDAGTWETLHGRNPSDRRRFTSRVSRGKSAVSHFQVRTRFKGATELQVVLKTGRTHQVRVHCYDHGFPVLGDPLYPPKHLSATVRPIHTALPGQALHAELLGFDHPLTGERLRFEAPPPEKYQIALDALKLLR